MNGMSNILRSIQNGHDPSVLDACQRPTLGSVPLAGKHR